MVNEQVDEQRDVIAFLSLPQSYGVAGTVERIDTHAAIVFLAGDRAYKLKRAVRYPYLDFSTMEQRRRVCEKELRLNRRTAPDLYLEVRSVNRQAGGALGFASGAPVDWLVVMQRFREEDRLDRVVMRGAFTPLLVRALADSVAHFHEEAERIAASNGATRLRRVIDGNRESMEALAEILPSAKVAGLHSASLDTLVRIAPLLDLRAAQGQVRQCHGDLHLANICLWNGQPTLFDCLEFNDELARIDVLYDLAFVLMDLWERGYPSHASQLFNRYFDMRAEGDGVAALPLFLSMRAAIRAHVSGAEARQRGVGAHGLRRRARGYLTAASEFLVPRSPRLVAIGGLSGTGKSTLALGIAHLVGAAPGARVLRSDVLRKRMVHAVPEARLGPQAYTQAHNDRVYCALADLARTMLEAGRTVIVDAVYAGADERRSIARVADELEVPFTGLWLEALPAVMRSRVDARRNDASDATSAIVERQLRYNVGDLSRWHVLDASIAIDDLVGRAQSVLSTA